MPGNDEVPELQSVDLIGSAVDKLSTETLNSIFNSLLDPHVLMKCVFNDSGNIIDFVYTAANSAAVEYLGLEKQVLLGSKLLDVLPGKSGCETLALYAKVMQENQDLVIDDVFYPGCVDGKQDNYCDVRAIKIGNTLSCTWRDVTERHFTVLALKEAEKYKALAESVTYVVYQLDKDGILLWVSPVVESVLMWRPNQLLGKYMFNLTHPNDMDKLKVWQDAVLAGVKTNTLVSPLELRCRLPDNTYRWVSIQSRPLFTAAGEFDGTIVGLRDVHEQVLAQQELEKKTFELEKSEQHFRLLAENATDVVMVINHEWNLTWVSPATERVLGYKVSDLLGVNTAKLVHPDDIGALSALRENNKDLEKGVSYQLRIRHANGTYRWMSGVSTIFYNDQGQVDGRISTLRDAHEQVLAQQGLEASEEKYRLLAQNATDAIWQLDTNGVITWVSPSSVTILGQAAQDLLKTNSLDLVHLEEKSKYTDWLKKVMNQERVENLEIRVFGRNKVYKWVLCRAKIFHDKKGCVSGCVVGLQDVTAQVKTREELAESEERFRLLAENASDVVADVTLDGVLRWVSPSVQETLGWEPGQVIGQSIVDLTHPDDREEDKKYRENALIRKEPPIEVRSLTINGVYRWMSVSIKAKTNKAGKVIGWVASLRDVHEQVLARQALVNSQRRYKILAENAADVVWQLDTNMVLQWVTPSIESVLGWRHDQLLGTLALDLVHGEDRKNLIKWQDAVQAGVNVEPFELRFLAMNGEYRWMSLQTKPVVEKDGKVKGAVVGLRDVHKEVIAREELARSEQTFRLAMKSAPQGMAIVSLYGKFIQVNEVLCKLTGKTANWLKDHSECDLIDLNDLEKDQESKDNLLLGKAEYDTHTEHLVTSGKKVIPIQHSLALVRDENKMPLFYVSQYQDMTAIYAYHSELEYKAQHDSLTGLINRSQLQEHIVQVLKRQARASGVPALLFCDLDHFKLINDTYGHAAGDYVLKIVAERIKTALRDDDEVARMGGDEFVIVLPEVHSSSSAVMVAEKIREAIAKELPVGKDVLTITASIGISLATPSSDGRKLLRNADEALYVAKNLGRNQVAVFNSSAKYR